MHGSLFTSHNALYKTYIRLTSSFFRPKVKNDIHIHIDLWFQCQQRKKICSQTFSPANTTDCGLSKIQNTYWHVCTAQNPGKQKDPLHHWCFHQIEVIAIPDMHAKTVTNELMIHWICRYGTPIQIHSDNAQVKFFNKTVAKYYNPLWTTQLWIGNTTFWHLCSPTISLNNPHYTIWTAFWNETKDSTHSQSDLAACNKMGETYIC